MRIDFVTNYLVFSGFVPNVEFNNSGSMDFQKENQQEKSFPRELPNNDILLNYHMGEPQNYFDYYQFSAWTQVPAKIVSPKLKSILENFNLPSIDFIHFK